MIFVVSGPSGAGKTHLLEFLYESGFDRVIPYTTRRPRSGEVEGRDFNFVNTETFQDMILGDTLFDWDFVFANYYGYGRELEIQALASDDVAIPVVARMALRLRSRLPRTYLAFLDDDDSVLDRRVADKGLEASEAQNRREAREEERRHAPLFDVRVGPDDEISKEMVDRLVRHARQVANAGPTPPKT